MKTLEKKTSAPLLTIQAAMERLGVSRTSLYALIKVRLIERTYLKAPPNPDGSSREDWPRITLESIERYERGEAKAIRTLVIPQGRGRRRQVPARIPARSFR